LSTLRKSKFVIDDINLKNESHDFIQYTERNLLSRKLRSPKSPNHVPKDYLNMVSKVFDSSSGKSEYVIVNYNYIDFRHNPSQISKVNNIE
jgi:hypothetical protein